MSKYELIALDMDGTLLNSHKKISKPTIKAIEKAIDNNKQVVLSTGRAVAELELYKNELASIQYGVLESGSLVYDFKDQKIIYQEIIPFSLIKKILEFVCDEDIMIHFLTNGKSIIHRNNRNNLKKYQMQIYQSLFNKIATPIDNFYEYAKNNKIEKINLYHTCSQARENTYNKLKELPLTFTFAETSSLEISPLNITKAHGLIKLCNYLKININNTIAVGDANNDFDVLKAAGLAIGMQNANSKIKNICDVIVSDNDHDGCKEAIEKYLL